MDIWYGMIEYGTLKAWLNNTYCTCSSCRAFSNLICNFQLAISRFRNVKATEHHRLRSVTGIAHKQWFILLVRQSKELAQLVFIYPAVESDKNWGQHWQVPLACKLDLWLLRTWFLFNFPCKSSRWKKRAETTWTSVTCMQGLSTWARESHETIYGHNVETPRRRTPNINYLCGGSN